MVANVFKFKSASHVDHNSLAEALAHEKAAVALQLISFLVLVFFSQPGFLEAKQVGSHQMGVSVHILDMLAQGPNIEGGDPQTFHLRIHPAFRVPVEANLPHSLGFLQNFLIDSDLVWVKVVDDGELLEAAATTQHHVHHSWLVRACHVHHQRVGWAHRSALKIAAVRYVLENIIYKIKSMINFVF